MSEGPYRDLGGGFARLTGIEGVRRAPSHIETVEDALLELVRNAVDEGAGTVYVASSLRSRRYRELVVLDDGGGMPESYRETIFEPGVTTRHLAPSRLAGRTHGAGLSLHHIRESAVSAEVLSAGSPTSIRVVFDIRVLPERSLQSGRNSSRGSRSNLRATLEEMTRAPYAPDIFYGSPASVAAILLNKRIIPGNVGVGDLDSWCGRMFGGGLSRRTLQRVRRGLVEPAGKVSRPKESVREGKGSEASSKAGRSSVGATLALEDRDLSRIRGVIESAASESYLEVGEIFAESKEGEISIRAEIYEAEEEYDG